MKLSRLRVDEASPDLSVRALGKVLQKSGRGFERKSHQSQVRVQSRITTAEYRHANRTRKSFGT